MGEINWEYTVERSLNYGPGGRAPWRDLVPTLLKILKVTSRARTCPREAFAPQKTSNVSHFFSNLAIKPSANKRCWHFGWLPTELQFLFAIFPGWDHNSVQTAWRFADNENYQLSALVYILAKAFPGPWAWAPSKFTKWQPASQPSDGVGTWCKALFLRSPACSTSVGFWQYRIGQGRRRCLSIKVTTS